MGEPTDEEWRLQIEQVFRVDSNHNVHPQNTAVRVSPGIQQFLQDQGEVSHYAISGHVADAGPDSIQ